MKPWQAEPRAAYLHIPFCVHRCGYCNFTVVAGRDDLIGSYLDALEREIESLGRPHSIETLFIGGGTPTHLPPEPLTRLLALVREWLPSMPGCEWSVEANPADLDEHKVALLSAVGVNRLSLGAQSFRPAKLALLERDHAAADIERSVLLARRHVGSVSLDLIFGTPDESLADWRDDLNQTIDLAPDHISTYGLTFEKGTSFGSRLTKGDLRRIDEELERDQYALAIETLASAGFEQYEVSNFARPGHRCRHNEVYWSGSTYFGFGAGAARYVAGRRETNHRSTTTYIKRVLADLSPIADSECLSPEDRAREALVLALRRIEGVTRKEFADRMEFEIDALAAQPLREFVALGLLADDGDRVRLTREGLYISDALWPRILKT